jgi:hypothetical protein
MIKYSGSTRGFYDDAIHGESSIPADAVNVTQKEYDALFEGQRHGLEIVLGEDGRPILAAPTLDPDQREAAFSVAVTARLDAFATGKQYDSITTARMATLSEDFSEDGRIANAAYDATWTAAIALIPQVRDGTLTPTAAAEQLPTLTWEVEQ